MRTIENLGLCPKCGSNTDTFRHLYAKVWCTNPECGFVLRQEGEGAPWNEKKAGIAAEQDSAPWSEKRDDSAIHAFAVAYAKEIQP